jgi:predicted aspartyl protease
MNTLFVNGRHFPHVLSLSPPGNRKAPYVSVNMAFATKMVFAPVLGKVDTGADFTLLTLSTARALGIEDPTHGSFGGQTVTVANGQKLVCHRHTIFVNLSTGDHAFPQFYVHAGVSDCLVNNLFGIDWLYSLCIAVDRQKVHFLFG